MNTEINNRLDIIIDILNDSTEIKRLKELKQSIYEDKNLKEELDMFHRNDYDSSIIKIKKEIINNPKVREFREIEDKINLLILAINKKLSVLTEEKSCSNENN